jgi:hypothetical protein
MKGFTKYLSRTKNQAMHLRLICHSETPQHQRRMIPVRLSTSLVVVGDQTHGVSQVLRRTRAKKMKRRRRRKMISVISTLASTLNSLSI